MPDGCTLRKIMIADISMWLDFEKNDLQEMRKLNPLSEQYRLKWMSSGSFHSMAHAVYICGLKAGILTVEDFTGEFFGKAA